jgi:Tol biopolymer transport system component
MKKQMTFNKLSSASDTKFAPLKFCPRRFANPLIFFSILIALSILTLSAQGIGSMSGIPAEIPTSNETIAIRLTKEAALEQQSVIFDSNRSGTFGIYQLLKDTEAPLIDSPDSHEMTPALNSDGSQLVYALTKSTKRGAPSEIWIYDLRSEERRKISDNGAFPSFSADGEIIYFERDRKKVIAYSRTSGAEAVIFPTEQFNKFQRYEVVKPRLSEDGATLAFTSDADGRWHAYLVDLKGGRIEKLGKGCQPFPLSISKGFFVSEPGFFSPPYITRFDGTNSTRATNKDPRREYFPYFRNDILLFARGKGSSHEEDNYELFLRKEGQEIQLTSNGATNRWPQLVR